MGVYKPKGSKFYRMDFVYKGIRVAKSTGKTSKVEANMEEALERQKIDEGLTDGPAVVQQKKFLSELIQRAYDEVICERKDGDVMVGRLTKVMEIAGDVPLKMVNADYLHKVKMYMSNSGRAPVTVNHYLAHLRQVLNLAVDWGWLVKAPKFSMKKVPAKGRTFVYSKEDEEKIISWFLNGWGSRPHVNAAYSSFGSDMADLFAVLIDTGMRLGEATQLDKANGYTMDLEQGIFRLDPADIDLKSGRPRVVPMTKRVKAILAQRLEATDKPFAFDKSRCAKAMRMMQKELGYGPEACLHACRHTNLTRLLRAGVDIETVRCWAGHCSVVVTQRYLQTDETMLKNAVKALEEGYGDDAPSDKPTPKLRAVK